MPADFLPTVVLIGRTNVGKSYLFNRLTESDQALVSKIAGTTRDLNKGITEWQGYRFFLVDTGGIDLSKPDDIEIKVLEQVWKTIDKADLVVLVTDTKKGLIAADQKIAKQLRENGYNFVVAANKADSPQLRKHAAEFYQLNDRLWPVSALNGGGTGDFLDGINKILFENEGVAGSEEQIKDKPIDITISIAGVTNVGKSSLLNALLKRQEVIVSPQPHTTRESRHTFLEYNNKNLKLVDTAGIRKANKMRHFILQKSAKRSLDAILVSDWTIFVIDSTQDKWGEQERYILDTLIKSGVSIVVAANKWDLLDGEDRFKEFQQRWYRTFGHKYWIPVVPISAETGWHVNKLLDTIIKMNDNRLRQLPSSALNRLLKGALIRRRPQKRKGPEAPFIHSLKQMSISPPTFEIVIDYNNTLAESYVRFLEKMLREKFDFTATPLRMYVRSVK